MHQNFWRIRNISGKIQLLVPNYQYQVAYLRHLMATCDRPLKSHTTAFMQHPQTLYRSPEPHCRLCIGKKWIAQEWKTRKPPPSVLQTILMNETMKWWSNVSLQLNLSCWFCWSETTALRKGLDEWSYELIKQRHSNVIPTVDYVGQQQWAAQMDRTARMVKAPPPSQLWSALVTPTLLPWPRPRDLSVQQIPRQWAPCKLDQAVDRSIRTSEGLLFEWALERSKNKMRHWDAQQSLRTMFSRTEKMFSPVKGSLFENERSTQIAYHSLLRRSSSLYCSWRSTWVQAIGHQLHSNRW